MKSLRSSMPPCLTSTPLRRDDFIFRRRLDEKVAICCCGSLFKVIQ